MHTFSNKIKAVALLLCLLTAVTLCGCASSGQQEETQPTETALSKEYTPAPSRKVIIDTDAGADDCSAIILAAKSGNIDILGVTVLAGNVDLEQATLNTLSALEIAGCDAPVYKGASTNYNDDNSESFSVFGTDGMGDADLIHPQKKAEDKDAIDFILEAVKADPGEVEIVALGPATNISKAIEREPDTMKKVKHIWSMGTSGLGPGNATPVAEFNVRKDPEAYKLMLDSGIESTIIGFDMCGGEAVWTNEQFDFLESSGEIGKFVTVSFTKLREFYKNNGSEEGVSNCDPLAMTCLIYENFVTDTRRCHGSCVTDEGETCGQVIFYQEGMTYDIAENDFDYNITLVTDVEQSDYFELYIQAVTS